MSEYVFSTSGQNVLVFEVYPQNVSKQCLNFNTIWAYCGVGHYVTEPYRQGVIIGNVSSRMAYVASKLHCVIHAGMSVDLCKEYIEHIKDIGYDEMTETTFNISSRHLLVINSNDSLIVPRDFSFFNHGTEEFKVVEPLFEQCKLADFGKSLLSDENASLLDAQTKNASRGQPVMINFGYAQQNSTDSSTIPGLNIPKLTTQM